MTQLQKSGFRTQESEEPGRGTDLSHHDTVGGTQKR